MWGKDPYPDKRPQVGNRQVDTLLSHELRTALGNAQPRSDAWARLQPRLQAGYVAATVPGQRLLARLRQSLLAARPRLSAVGVVLAMLALFLHSSLSPLPPPAQNTGITPTPNVPAVPPQVLDTDPRPNMRPSGRSLVPDIPDPIVRSHFDLGLSAEPVEKPAPGRQPY